MRVETLVETYFTCPECNTKFSSSIDHIISEGFHRNAEGWSSIQWDCKKCGYPAKAFINAAGEVRLDSQPEGKRRPTTEKWVLLRLYKLLANGSIVHIIVKENDYHHNDDENQKTKDSKEAYFYDEHTCPSNWLQHCIFENDDDDPHGLFQWVASTPVTEANKDYRSYEEFCMIFPALHNAINKTIDGSANPILQLTKQDD